jgi:hypothetical protein
VNDEEIDAQVAMLRSAIEVLLSMKRHSVPNARPIAPPTTAKPFKGRPKWMLAARAFADRYPLNAWQVRRICANHDWALKLAGTWHVDFDRFSKFADKVDRDEAAFDSSEKFASSLANEQQPNENEHRGKSIAEEDDDDQNRETA